MRTGTSYTKEGQTGKLIQKIHMRGNLRKFLVCIDGSLIWFAVVVFPMLCMSDCSWVLRSVSWRRN